jgi:DNA-nicking Smr family endonuclease
MAQVLAMLAPFYYLPCRNKLIMARIKLDLHDMYNNSAAIDIALQHAFEEAIDKKIREVEIIPGKGSGQLRKKVERFLQLPHIKPLYHRIENDSKNFGRLFVYFKF